MTSASDLGPSRLIGLGGMLLLCLLLTQASAAPGDDRHVHQPGLEDFADTFADPAVIKAKDGYWYAYGTSDPLREGKAVPHHPHGTLEGPG